MKRYKDTEYFITKDGGIYRYGRKLKPHKTKKGYHQVKLYSNSKSKIYQVHRLVAETYIPNTENKPQVNHINGIKTDNRLENLEWVTNQENVIHSYKNGLQEAIKGEKHYNSKLSEEDVKWIKQNYIPRHPKYGATALGKKFNVWKTTISAILKNKTWQHI